MVDHLAKFSPPLWRVAGEQPWRAVVRWGIARAEAWGWQLRGPIRLYLELMLLFGSHFDSDPQYPWAGDILRNKSAVSEFQRAEWLWEKTLDYQAKVAGDGGVNTRRALERLLHIGRNPLEFAPDDFETTLMAEFATVFPEKVEVVGASNIRRLIDTGRVQSQTYGFTGQRGEMLLIVLMFGFGHGCARDGLYPWIGRTLADSRVINAAARAKRLERKSLVWLEHVLGAPDRRAGR